MPYRFEQLPYLGFEKKAKAAKTYFDHRGGHYPFEIRLTAADDTLLLTLTYTRVHDRNPTLDIQPVEWDVPLNFEIWEHGELYLSELVDEVKVQTDFLIQGDFAATFEG